MSGRPPRGRPGLRRNGFDEVPELSDEEVERRISYGTVERPPAADPALEPPLEPPLEPGGAAPLEPAVAPAIVPATLPAADAAVEPGALTTVVRSSGVHTVVDRRRLLWRDSAMILVVVVLAMLGAQAFLPGAAVDPTETAIPSSVVTGSLLPGATLPPGVTFGPIIDPSLGIDATPTPIPVITLGPSPSPSPSPSPTPKPTAKVTPRPSVKPPTPPPPTIPPPTPPPPSPVARVNCDPPTGLQVTCTSTSSNILNNSEVWDMGDFGTIDSGGNGSSTITFTYTNAGTWTVTLMVTGFDGVETSTDTASVTVGP